LTQTSFAADNRITLHGTWSREQATALQRLLSDRLAQLLEREPEPASLDLSGIGELDACGCQLLVLFMENLRRRGISPVTCTLSEQVADQVALLGFSDAFSVVDTPGKL